MNELEGLQDLAKMAEELSGRYENRILCAINDHVVRISRMTEPYFWHFHPNSDELFIGVGGTVILETEEQRVELGPGQIFKVAQGVKHRTAPTGASSVNLTIERAEIETVKVEKGRG